MSTDALAPEGRRLQRALWPAAVVAWVVSGLAGLSLGALAVPPGELFAIAGTALGLPGVEAPDALRANVVLHLRAPRVLLAMAVGAALSVSGALVQGWFRNPLAEPGLLGVSGGASLAAATGIVLLGDLGGGLTVPLCAFLGGLAAVAAVVAPSAAQNRAMACGSLASSSAWAA